MVVMPLELLVLELELALVLEIVAPPVLVLLVLVALVMSLLVLLLWMAVMILVKRRKLVEASHENFHLLFQFPIVVRLPIRVLLLLFYCHLE